MASIGWVKTLKDFTKPPTKRTVKEHHGYVLLDHLSDNKAAEEVYWMNICNKHEGIFVTLYA